MRIADVDAGRARRSESIHKVWVLELHPPLVRDHQPPKVQTVGMVYPRDEMPGRPGSTKGHEQVIGVEELDGYMANCGDMGVAFLKGERVKVYRVELRIKFIP